MQSEKAAIENMLIWRFSGFIPDVILYLSYFYKTKELPVRLSYFWTAYTGTNVVAAFLAYGILRLRGVNGWEGWRYVNNFLIFEMS